MIIFFDDRPVRIVRTNQLSAAETSRFEHIVDLRLEKLQRSMLTGHVLFLNSTTTSAIQVIQMLEKEFPKDNMMVELHVLRACLAIRDGHVSVEDAVRSEPSE